VHQAEEAGQLGLHTSPPPGDSGSFWQLEP
jgi:hypothetical protein